MRYIYTAFILFISLSGYSQTKYGVFVGINAGAPFPSKVQKGSKGKLGVNPILGLTLVRENSNKLFYRASILLDTRSASYNSPITRDTLKITSYQLNGVTYYLPADDNKIGPFAGVVEGNFKNTYISLPFTMFYRIHPKFAVGLGPSLSYMLKGSHKGKVNGIAGDGILFVIKDEKFDETENLNKFEVAANLSFNYKFNEKIDVQWVTTYGFNSLVKPTYNFKDKLHNVYTNLTASYYF